MQQILTVWNALSARRRIMVVGASLAMFAAVLAMSRMASTPNMVLLYSGLESGAAGEVVSALEQRGVPYDVRGGSIFVPGSDRDALRMTLASEGLPANNNRGYELLDTLSGFGTTSQMFDAAYWRAKEGELARTIVSNPQITQARVHIANSSANPFQRDVTPSASISVTTTGSILSAAQARALKHLVASAVPGLIAENVAVIDGKGGLIGSEDDATPGGAADDKADQLRDRVQRLVEARVGSGNAVVEVSVDTDTQSESIVERSFDPDTRVVISSDTEERSSQSQDSGGGDVTVASNLPTGAGENGDNSSSQNSETRERVNYEVSETTREIIRAAGTIKRLTVAVLVNGSFAPNEAGELAFVPLPEAELTALRDLVASAVGFEEQRGDAITIRSLPFERPEGLGTEASAPDWLTANLDPLSLIQMGILAAVALILGLFVVRPILAGKAAGTPALAGGSALAIGNSMNDEGGEFLTGEIDPDDDFGNLPALSTNNDFGDMGMGMGMGMDDFGGSSEDPVERLRGLIDQRRDETVEILRSWLDEPEEAS
ncbi:flagellar basal-body MS-ring/collar protein FliF [Puniceibacterium sediminis]|uniref:Flagellar M-ring protein n=1 Tax=Puniceibacterium sediminis TaxID=1608407 RepID=A0A238VST8_9RHOB|nr:flagellar basal-body MS-ring/collar protein FliF [Puniceibacterium sediminis]SNR37296.1 flagellar M-ring protein FliF [Puniceibacterium sediminis]